MTKKAAPQTPGLDLAPLFQAAAQALAANQAALNQADTENHDHGDNMVQTFNMITQALAGQKSANPARQLQHASQFLTKNAKSGSAAAYAQGLAQAADKFKGQKAVTPDNAMLLVQSLLGGSQPPAQQQTGADLLGALLDGTQQAGQASGQAQGGLDLGSLLNAGASFLSAKQQGQTNLQAALTALIAAGPLGNKPHRQQSGQLVAATLLQTVAGLAKR
jgi:hypothetical protein